MNAQTPVTPGLPLVLQEITAERQRQVKDLNYTVQHDDGHTIREMVNVADSYTRRAWNAAAQWPSDPDYTDARDNLVKAATVLVAAIERLDREVARG